MKILAVDYGDARTGLAICDAGEWLASPVEVLHETNRKKLVEQIVARVSDLKAEEIVLGHPINMDGSLGPRSDLVKEIEKLLKEKTDIPITLWDERRTTVAATDILNKADVRGKKRKAVIDAVAAVLILEGYLLYRKNNKPGG